MDKFRLIQETDYDKFLDIAIKAYPGAYGVVDQEKREALKERTKTVQTDHPTIDYYGMYRDDKLLGIFRLHKYIMNIRGKMVKSWGIGLIAVDLIHKKQKVAKNIMLFYLNMLRKENVPLAILYPFRPDFYKKMGFGYGTPMLSYYLQPTSFPTCNESGGLSYLELRDIPALHRCYMAYVSKTHGMTERTEKTFEQMLKNPKNIVIGVKDKNSLSGYMIFSFESAKKDNFVHNDLDISELIFNDVKSFNILGNFIHRQADQINRVKYATQDEFFHYTLSDARNGTYNLLSNLYVSHETNAQGRGLMYRVVDIERLFLDLNSILFSDNSLKIKLTLVDTFMDSVSGDYYLDIQNGKIKTVKEFEEEVSITMDIAEFSSLIMGCISFNDLVRLGLVEVSQTKYIEMINEIFYYSSKPICMASF